MYKFYTFPLSSKGMYSKTTVISTSNLEEITVLDFLLKCKETNTKLQKHQIIHHLNSLGSHDAYETPQKRTSMRKLQQILRNLTEKGAPIVRTRNGVWIAESIEELEEYCDWLEKKAKADISSMMYMRRRILFNVGCIRPSLFDSITQYENEEI